MRFRAAGAVAFGLVVPAVVLAGAPKAVQMHVFVVAASDKGNDVDKRLEHFAADLKRQKLVYTSFQVVRERTVRLEPGKPVEEKLPNGKWARFEFRQVDSDGKLRIRVDVGKRYATYSIEDGGEFYYEAGPHRDGYLWLALTHKAE